MIHGDNVDQKFIWFQLSMLACLYTHLTESHSELQYFKLGLAKSPKSIPWSSLINT